MDRVSKIITEYKTKEWESEQLTYLMELRRELACLSYDISKKVREEGKEYYRLNSERKSKFYQAQVNHLETSGVGESEAKAKTDTAELRDKEAHAEGDYRGSKMVIKQVNYVLDSMSQDISWYKREKEQTDKNY